MISICNIDKEFVYFNKMEKPVDDCPLPSNSVHEKLPAVLIQVEIISQL